MSLYKMFHTDADAEKAGIVLDYGDTRFTVARAGGANADFKRLFTTKLKPYRRQIDAGTMDDDVANRLMAETYAETVIIGWEGRTVVDGEELWGPEIETPAGELKFTAEACVTLLLDLPELFTDLQAMANQAANFRDTEMEEDVKN
jgi:hypothetical protein